MPAEIMQFLFDLTLAHSIAWLQAKPSTRINGLLRTSSFLANEFLLFVGTKSIEHIANVHALIESGEKDPPKNIIFVDPMRGTLSTLRNRWFVQIQHTLCKDHSVSHGFIS